MFLAWLLYFSPALADSIHKIDFEGLTKTKESYLEGIIKCKEGGDYHEDFLKEDIQTIKNLHLFFMVDGEANWNETANAWDILFKVEEAKYLYPLFDISGFRSQLKIEAGFNQINFLGKAQSIGATYQYYDRHSITIFYNALRHKNAKTGHDIALTKYSTVEPLYFDDTVSNFNFDNYNISVGGHYWLMKNIAVGLGSMYMFENYRQRDTGTIDLGADAFSFHKYQIRGFLFINKVNEDREMYDGINNTLYAETVQTIDYPEISFVKFTNELNWFKQFEWWGNLAVRQRIGVATNNNSPFAPFVLDGFINVRGIGNRVARGTAEVILNLEYRQAVWRHKWFVIQLATFADFGTLREPGDQIVDMFNHKEMELFIGGGFRIHSRILYNTRWRMDYSFNPIDPSKHGLTFGIGQFF